MDNKRPPVVSLHLPLEEAQAISAAMSDLLCWVRGFNAAIPDELDRHPMGVEAIRNLRIKLNQAIEEPF